MLLDLRDKDSRSAGDFFRDPLVDSGTLARLPSAAPRRPEGADGYRLSAEWLIRQAGFAPGYSGATTQVALSPKNVLAVVNLGGATAQQVVDPASEVAAVVKRRFGLELLPAARLVALSANLGNCLAATRR
jgi:UDP-N-acetylmuramate dehydrogenase